MSVRTLLLLLILLYGSWWLVGERLVYYRFNQTLWAWTWDSSRYYMAQYLIDHQTLIGKSREEVRAMLWESTMRMGPQNKPYRLLYCLGTERGHFINIDDDWLEVGFDDNGRVTSNVIRSD